MKGIVFCTDNELDSKIASRVIDNMRTIAKARGFPIVTSSLKHRLDFGNANRYLPYEERGIFTHFKQMLVALEHSTADIIFCCEADILYHPSHFDFELPAEDAYYYDINNWTIWMAEGMATRVDVAMPLSMLCGDRELLIEHYRKKISRVIERQEEFLSTGRSIDKRQCVSKRMAAEPGGDRKAEKIDNYPMKWWKAEWPSLDLRHGDAHLTKGKRRPSDYIDHYQAAGWQEAGEVPGWGKVSEITKGMI